MPPCSAVNRHLLLALLIVTAGMASACREIVEKEATEKMERAREAMEKEDWQDADEFFHEALLLDESRGDAWVGRAMSLTQLGDLDAAREHYEAALRRFAADMKESPDDFVLLRKKILVLVLLDRIGEAEELAEEAAGATDLWGEEAVTLPDLVKTLREHHADMILSRPASEPSESTP